MEDYECHVTLEGPRHLSENIVAKHGRGWTFSCIDGDPVLGNFIFSYATNHYTTEEEARMELNSAMNKLGQYGGTDVVVRRAKIEKVIYDMRYNRG